jgi:hypothetical protein
LPPIAVAPRGTLTVEGRQDVNPAGTHDPEGSVESCSHLVAPGQVALIHDDSHYFKLDQPLLADDGTVLGNFTRVETWGAGNVDWVSAVVDTSAPTLFIFRPMIGAANAG